MGLSPNWIQKVPNRGLPILGSSLSAPFPRNLLIDGDCDKSGVADWTVGNGAVLTKQTANVIQGGRCLRVTYDAINNPFARQTILTVTKTYRMIGWAHGDGTAYPRIYCGVGLASWEGTTSTAWQYYDITETATAAAVTLQTIVSAAGYCEFDGMWIFEVS